MSHFRSVSPQTIEFRSISFKPLVAPATLLFDASGGVSLKFADFDWLFFFFVYIINHVLWIGGSAVAGSDLAVGGADGDPR